MTFSPAIHAWAEGVGSRWGDLFHRTRRADPGPYLDRQLEHAGPILRQLSEAVRRGFERRLDELGIPR